MSPAEASERTTKRKRQPQTDETNIGTKLEKKLHHDAKEVRKAAKKAKTFEMQKVLKKMKDARHKGDDNAVKDIEAQYLALKQLDPGPIADSALSTKIKKDKLLSQDPNLQAAMSKSLSSILITSAVPGSALGVVQSRLLSSKVLAVDVSRIIEGLRRLLNPVERTYAEIDQAEVSPPQKKKQKMQQNESLPKVPPVVTSSEDESRADLQDDGWESGTVSDGDHFIQGDSGVDEGPDEEDDSISDSDGCEDIPVPRERPSRGESKATQSTFLPSLSVGFIRGDSDTDFSDSEEKAADAAKKNRRGQRARRAIWEKKFGRHANHVMKQKASDPSGIAVAHKGQRQHRNDDRDSDGGPFSGGRRNAQIPDKNRSYASARHMLGNRKEEKPLHPSWEAKKKQQNVAIVPAQGTRIVFT
ncbi:Bud-site selection protein [Suillus decipiens]|nr:Bud-site selection protein [Suillus decipiens]